jgi:hypothetical protein
MAAKCRWLIEFLNGKSAHVEASGKRMAIAEARVEAKCPDSPVKRWHRFGPPRNGNRPRAHGRNRARRREQSRERRSFMSEFNARPSRFSGLYLPGDM